MQKDKINTYELMEFKILLHSYLLADVIVHHHPWITKLSET